VATKTISGELRSHPLWRHLLIGTVENDQPSTAIKQ